MSGKAEAREHGSLALLGICDRVSRAKIPKASVYRRLWRGAAEAPETLGEHLRRKRVDMGLTQAQLAQTLEVGWQSVQRWEHNHRPIRPSSRAKVVAFLGYDPALDHM